MSEPKPIIVVHPSVADGNVKRQLRDAGYTVVVSEDPSLFTVVQVLPIAPGDMAGAVMRAAIKAIARDSCSPAKDFGKALTDELTREDQP